MTELLNAKSSEIGHFFRLALVVYLGHGILHPVAVFNLFLQINFLGEV